MRLQTGLLFILLVLTTRVVRSQNPIVPPGVYVADPAAHVCDDERLYLI